MGSGTKLEEKDHVETLLSAAEGETVLETAKRWRCSSRCVSNRRQSAIEWLGAENLTQAVALAFMRGHIRVKPH